MKGKRSLWLTLSGIALGVAVELAPIPAPLRAALRLAALQLGVAGRPEDEQPELELERKPSGS